MTAAARTTARGLVLPERSESAILGDIIRVLHRVPGVRLRRNNSGAARLGGKSVRFGEPGSADLVGLVSMPVEGCPGASGRLGVYTALEVKAPGEDRASTDHAKRQAAWGEEIRSFGGFYAVVHSAEEALAAVRRAQRGASR